MNKNDIATARLNSQQITGSRYSGVKELVGWMGVMQAQDAAMANWAIGARLPNATEQTVEEAINKGEILRIHVLRPTWHLVSAEDIYWMLDLTARAVKTAMDSTERRLELSQPLLKKSNAVLEKAMRGGKHLTREEIQAEFKRARIDIYENRLSHLLGRAEAVGLLCSGALKNGRTTHALLEERVPRPKPLTREEALAKLASKYFNSHGPATLQDFNWWSGLTAREANLALEFAKPGLRSETIDGQVYWLANTFSIPKQGKEGVHLLPAYDEYIISYKNRSAVLALEDHARAVSRNGLFKPVIVVNGRVAGTWKRTIKKDKVIVETEFFDQADQIPIKSIEKAADLFGRFLGLKVELIQS